MGLSPWPAAPHGEVNIAPGLLAIAAAAAAAASGDGIETLRGGIAIANQRQNQR